MPKALGSMIFPLLSYSQDLSSAACNTFFTVLAGKNVLLSRPFCKTPSALWHRNQQTLLSRHPFVKASFCQGILLPRAPFCQGSSGNSELQPKAALVNCRCRRTRYFWHTLPQSLGALTPKLTEWASLDKCPTKSSDLKLE